MNDYYVFSHISQIMHMHITVRMIIACVQMKSNVENQSDFFTKKGDEAWSSHDYATTSSTSATHVDGQGI